MNLDQIRHSFETLQHLQSPLLRKIPPLCRAIEEGQLDNTEYVKPVIKMLQQWAAAQTTLAEALPQPDAAQLTTLPPWTLGSRSTTAALSSGNSWPSPGGWTT